MESTQYPRVRESTPTVWSRRTGSRALRVAEKQEDERDLEQAVAALSRKLRTKKIFGALTALHIAATEYETRDPLLLQISLNARPERIAVLRQRHAGLLHRVQSQSADALLRRALAQIVDEETMEQLAPEKGNRPTLHGFERMLAEALYAGYNPQRSRSLRPSLPTLIGINGKYLYDVCSDRVRPDYAQRSPVQEGLAELRSKYGPQLLDALGARYAAMVAQRKGGWEQTKQVLRYRNMPDVVQRAAKFSPKLDHGIALRRDLGKIVNASILDQLVPVQSDRPHLTYAAFLQMLVVNVKKKTGWGFQKLEYAFGADRSRLHALASADVRRYAPQPAKYLTLEEFRCAYAAAVAERHCGDGLRSIALHTGRTLNANWQKLIERIPKGERTLKALREMNGGFRQYLGNIIVDAKTVERLLEGEFTLREAERMYILGLCARLGGYHQFGVNTMAARALGIAHHTLSSRYHRLCA